MNSPQINPLDAAVENLLAALDKTPRIGWRQTVNMTLQAVKEIGYAEGYRVGFIKEPPAAEAPALQHSATQGGGALPFGQSGEDRTLGDKPTHDEALEDFGYEILRAFARRLGQAAQHIPLMRPENAFVELEKHDLPDRIASSIMLKFYFNMKGI
jgi:hypothetical protein